MKYSSHFSTFIVFIQYTYMPQPDHVLSSTHYHVTQINVWQNHDDVIKWKHFPRYLPFVRGIHRSPVNSPHKDQWRGALMLHLICVSINGWANNREAGELRRHRAHYDVTVMIMSLTSTINIKENRPHINTSSMVVHTLQSTSGLGNLVPSCLMM